MSKILGTRLRLLRGIHEKNGLFPCRGTDRFSEHRGLFLVKAELDGVTAGERDHLDGLHGEGLGLDGQWLIQRAGGEHLEAADGIFDHTLGL